MNKLNFKRVLILGKGISGDGAAKALDVLGIDYDVIEDDQLDEKLSANDYDVIVISPGLAKTHPVYIKANGIKIMSEIELGYLICDKPIIAVTGTNGKTTTVRMIGKMLGNRACVTGNVGRSFALDATLDYDAYVVEVSSFQLESVHDFKPNVAIITNLAPDHIDRHGSFTEYVNVKLGIAKNMTASDTLILNSADIVSNFVGFNPKCRVCYFNTRGKVNGAYALGKKLYCYDSPVCRRDELKLRGEHNEANALAAILGATIMGAKQCDIVNACHTFCADPHRLEYVDSVRGVAFYDDSKGTNISATMQAMRSMPGEFALIVGGRAKGYEFDELFCHRPSTLKNAYVIGECTPSVLAAAERHAFKNIRAVKTLERATIEAYHSGADSVLLSPATAGFDMFRDYRERGEAFCAVVRSIKQSESI